MCCVCVCVCVCVVSVCMCVCVCTCMFVSERERKRERERECVWVCVHMIVQFVFVCMYAYMPVCMQKYACVCVSSAIVNSFVLPLNVAETVQYYIFVVHYNACVRGHNYCIFSHPIAQ